VISAKESSNPSFSARGSPEFVEKSTVLGFFISEAFWLLLVTFWLHFTPLRGVSSEKAGYFFKKEELYNHLYSSSEDEWFIQFVYSFQVWHLKLHYFLEGFAVCDSIQVLNRIEVMGVHGH